MVLPTRSIGKLLCTKAGRPEIFFAAVFGAMLGFVPGFVLLSDVFNGLLLAPALVLGLVAAALALRVHLGVFGLSVAIAKLLAMCTDAVRYWVGETLVEALTPVFAWLRDMPVVAWCGPAHYATVGGLVLGPAVGVLMGWAFWRGLHRLRQHMSAVEENSERYQKLSGRRTLRLLGYLLVGAKMKQGLWSALAEQKLRRAPRPRLWGVGATAVLVVGLGWLHGRLVSPQFQRTVQTTLEASNGATVDLREAKLDLLGGRARLVGLAIADPEALDTDLFRAERLELALDTGALLKRRFVVDEISAINAETGAKRAVPGELITAAADSEASPDKPPPSAAEPKERTLEDWIAEAERWHGRLEQVAHWIDVVAQHVSTGGDAEDGADEGAVAVAADEALGTASVEAPAIASRHPGVLIRKVRIDGIASAWLDPGDVLDLHASNVSSHPGRVDQPMELTLSARSGAFRVVLRREGGASGALSTRVQWKGQPVDELMAGLGWSNAPLRGGTIDVELRGRLAFQGGTVSLDLPLQITARDTTLAVPGAQPARLAELPVTIGLRGPLARPLVRLDDEALTRALLDAGQQRLAALVEERAAKLLSEHVPASPLVESLVRDPGAVLTEAEKRAAAAKREAEEEAKKRAASELQKRLPGGLQGLFPPKKK